MDDESAPRDGSRVKAVDTSLDLLEATQELGGATFAELRDELDMSKSSVYSHLNTLVTRGYLVKDGDEYRPSLKLLGIGELVKWRHLALFTEGKSEVHRLANETDELAWIMVEERNYGVYIHKQHGNRAVETGNFPIGQQVPLHATASGKVVLAHLPEERVEEIVESEGLIRRTPNTITAREELYDALEQIREQGYGLSSEESVLGIREVAAPVIAVDGSILGTVSVSGPVGRLRGSLFREELPDRLIESSNIIEIKIMDDDGEYTP